MYDRLRAELETRLATIDDVLDLARGNVVIARSLKVARDNGLSQPDAMIQAVVWLAIQNNQLIQESLLRLQQMPPENKVRICGHDIPISEIAAIGIGSGNRSVTLVDGTTYAEPRNA